MPKGIGLNEGHRAKILPFTSRRRGYSDVKWPLRTRAGFIILASVLLWLGLFALVSIL